ncbi:MAG: hypothetical protein JG777_2289 [Clostridia bacterium]|uniref:DUF6171 family protein n=1 Tax=Petroclostridium xylanilyticum TaxID=1792311 RepID=UPI000B99A982|nr:DUF6171 family protein [Petroclostridium xylanilyticum]MBZ4646800.1 hypothetical protein [Clostridia bacterium]
MSERNECKGCSVSVKVSFDEIKARMSEYMIMLDGDDCVPDNIYQRRLSECNSCPGLYYGTTCRYCGCFVQMRAKRKDRNCPYPGKSKW